MFCLYLLRLAVNLLPLIVVLVVNYKIYTKTQQEGIALTITGVFWVLFLIFTMLGIAPKNVNRAVTLVIVFVVLKLMQPLLTHMCTFAGAVAIGALLDAIVIMPIITRYKELRVATKTADITTSQIKQAVQEIIEEKEANKEERSGRV